MTFATDRTAHHLVRHIGAHDHPGLVRLSPRTPTRTMRSPSYPYADRPDVPANIVLGEG